MKIAIDTETRAVLTWRGEALLSLPMTRGDRFPVEVKFISSGKFVELASGAAGRLMLKRPGAYASAPAAAAASWVKSGAAASCVYTFDLGLNTQELTALLTGASVDLVLEIEWGYGNIVQSTVPVSVAVARDYIQGTEGTPAAALDLQATQAQARSGTDNTTWMSPLRTAQAIDSRGVALALALGS